MISIASCRICSLSPDIRRAIDIDITNGMNDTEIGRKYAKEIHRSQPRHDVSKHKRLGHVGKQPPICVPQPGTLASEREEKHRKTVEERQDQIYDMAFGLIKIAAKKGDIRGAASCLAQAVNVTGQMRGSEPGKNDSPKESGFLNGYLTQAEVVYAEKK